MYTHLSAPANQRSHPPHSLPYTPTLPCHETTHTCPHLQVRAEFLDITLAVLCFVAPEIEQRLRQVGPGRGRAGVGQVQGASQVFALADSLADAVKKVRRVLCGCCCAA